MCPHVYFVFIFLHLQVFFANCLPQNDSHVTYSSTSVKTDSLNSTEPNFNLTCPSNRCLRKCCKANEIYDWMNKNCLPDHDNKLQKANWFTKFLDFEVIYDSQCPMTIIPLNNTQESDEYTLFSNGSMFGLGKLMSFNQYCMDYLTEDGSISPLICYQETFGTDEMESDEFIFYLDSIGFGISVLFLIITLGLYLTTPQLRKKVHDKCVLCHLVSLIIGFSSLIGIQNITVENPACAFLSYMVQFWFLASFFWLNIMCIDMWRIIGNIPILEGSNVRKLLKYSLYAWGCPSLILIFSLLADNFLPSSHPLRTGFAEETCWFRHNKGNDSWLDPNYIHFYSFVSITLLVNIYIFVDIAFMIKFQNKSWKENDNADSKRHKAQNTRVILYLKLFIVMGLNWMMEVISYHCEGKNKFWVTIDFITNLQGVFLFIVFICNKRVLMILNQRFFPKKMFLKQCNITFSDRNRKTSTKISKASITEDITVTSDSLVTTNL